MKFDLVGGKSSKVRSEVEQAHHRGESKSQKRLYNAKNRLKKQNQNKYKTCFLSSIFKTTVNQNTLDFH